MSEETKVKQMVALPDGKSADLMDPSHWNMGMFELQYEDGEEDGAKEYLDSIRKMITFLNDQPIAFLQDNDLFLDKVTRECEMNYYCITDDVFLWFAFPGKAEKCAEIMRTISCDAQYNGTIHFYDMFEKKFWYQGVDYGEWETGWIQSGGDNKYFSTYLNRGGVPNNIKENHEYLKNNGLKKFNEQLHHKNSKEEKNPG